jgi:hypothetical protein
LNQKSELNISARIWCDRSVAQKVQAIALPDPKHAAAKAQPAWALVNRHMPNKFVLGLRAANTDNDFSFPAQ